MRSILCLTLLLAGGLAHGEAVEVFAKGSLSKNYISKDSWTISASATMGLGMALFRGVKLEGRYSNISSLQNTLQVPVDTSSVTLTDFKTQTVIYSVGLDLDFLGETSPFQPFLFVGIGYLETERSYYLTSPSISAAIFTKEPKQLGFTGNLGLGFRVRLAKALAFEIEAFAYGMNIHKPNPLIDLYGTVGIRLFL